MKVQNITSVYWSFCNLTVRTRSLIFLKWISMHLSFVNALLDFIYLLHRSALHKHQSITALLKYRFVFICFQIIYCMWVQSIINEGLFFHKSWVFYMKLYIYSTYSQPLIWETVCSTMNIIARFLVSFICLSIVTFSYDLCFTFLLPSNASDNRSGRNTEHFPHMCYL